MLTDGYFVKPNGDKVFFPGHVMVWEKIPGEDDDRIQYFIYQSYINEYDFKGSLIFRRISYISRKKIEYYTKVLNTFVNTNIWDSDMVDFWKDQTNVYTKTMLNSCPDNDAFYICYKKRLNTDCLNNLRTYVKKTLAQIPANSDSEIYGKNTHYDESSAPLTNGKMRTKLSVLARKLRFCHFFLTKRK
jgi:hypothetical protein